MSATPPKPTRAEREWQQRRSEILESAWELFMENGYAGTTMQDIAERAEYSVGYIYKHFPGKQELREAIFAEHFEVVMRIRREVLEDPDLGPLAGLRKEIRLTCAHLSKHPGLVSLFMGPAGLSGDVRKRIDEEFRIRDHQRFQAAMDAGEIHHGDPALLEAACKGVFSGLVQLIHGSGHPERYAEIPDIVDELVLKPVEKKKPGTATH